MSWRVVARKDVADAGRVRSLWLLAGLFVVLFAGTAGAVQWLGFEAFGDYVDLSFGLLALVVPLVALVLGYKAIIAERSTGSVALLLSLPHSRWDALLGKFLGRSVVLTVPVLVGVAVGGLVAAVLLESVEPLRYLLFVLAGVLLGLAYLGLAVGLSASTTSRRRVIAGAFGAYVLFGTVWEDLVYALALILFRFNAQELSTMPDWSVLLEFASPSVAYSFLGAEVLETGQSPVGAASSRWFLEPWIAVAVLLAWIAVPVLVGYWRFSRSDLAP